MTSGSGRPTRAACATRPCAIGTSATTSSSPPTAELMALASYDGSVRVRDFATGTVVVELPAHPDLVYSASFSPDGRLLVTACRDRTVRVWDWRAGRLACPPFEHAKDAIDRDLHAGRALGALGERRWHRPRLGLADRQAGHATPDDFIEGRTR